MSQMTPASDGAKRRDGSARDAVESAAYDITDAIEAVTEFLALAPDEPADVSILNSEDVEVDFVIGHLRAILAALSAPYVPGMVEVEPSVFRDDKDASDACAILTRYTGVQTLAGWDTETRYFLAVTE